MDFVSLIQLISLLAGSPQPDAFPALHDGGPLADYPVSIGACPRPLPVGEIDGVTVLCGTVNVPEDHASPGGKRIDLSFSILKSASAFPEADPVVYLQGGPGGSALSQIPLIERAFKPWRTRRDIVMFDQRAAGISGASVNCFNALASGEYDIASTNKPEHSDVVLAQSLIEKCVAELKDKGIDLGKYNTTQNAYDVNAVVNALGYGSYNLYGISYGTKLALEVMRVKPEGIRSVIIDGVAPSWVHLYNSFAFKTDEAIQTVVDQCAADPVCNAAYPDLGKVFIDVLDKAAQGKIVYRDEKMSVELAIAPVNTRNGQYDFASTTRYIPAYVYELHNGKETPTVDMLVDAGFRLAKPGESEALAAAAKLPADEQTLVRQVVDNLTIRERADKGISDAVAALRTAAEKNDSFGPIAGLFDQELEKAVTATLRADKSKARALLADYTGMQTAEPSKTALSDFVGKYTSGDAKARLTALIAGMSAQEVEGSFAIIRRDTYASQEGFLFGFYVGVYACQEDIPYNSYEGYQKLTAGLRYPHLGDGLYDPTAKSFFDICKPFSQNPRDHWHEPVVSDIPTLSFGSLYDIQTPASWAKIAIEKMSNAQAFLIPEAGHGAVIYQPCVADMSVAFVDNPGRKFDNSCADSIKIDWYVAPWVKKKS